MHSKQLFFLNQTFAQCVFKETQPLPRSQTGSLSTSKTQILIKKYNPNNFNVSVLKKI